jgi:hypothetical protein
MVVKRIIVKKLKDGDLFKDMDIDERIIVKWKI